MPPESTKGKITIRYNRLDHRNPNVFRYNGTVDDSEVQNRITRILPLWDKAKDFYSRGPPGSEWWEQNRAERSQLAPIWDVFADVERQLKFTLLAEVIGSDTDRTKILDQCQALFAEFKSVLDPTEVGALRKHVFDQVMTQSGYRRTIHDMKGWEYLRSADLRGSNTCSNIYDAYQKTVLTGVKQGDSAEGKYIAGIAKELLRAFPDISFSIEQGSVFGDQTLQAINEIGRDEASPLSMDAPRNTVGDNKLEETFFLSADGDRENWSAAGCNLLSACKLWWKLDERILNETLDWPLFLSDPGVNASRFNRC